MSLRKEMFIAIFLGLLLGGGAALVFAQIPQKLLSGNSQNSNNQETTTVPTPSPTPLLDNSLTLDVLFPEQQAYIEEDEINVSGKTSPGATVGITSSVDETTTIAEDDGTFSAPISLAEGANELLVVAFLNDEISERVVVVNYTQEEF